jgi:5-methylcytosine-specific restriction protein A
MKNPKWHRKELILALDLYFKLEPGQISSRNLEIIALSETLNKLDIYKDKPDAVKYRNANGAAMKLSNFLAVDPNYHGKGLKAGGKLDREIFEEFQENREGLKREARSILKTII